MTCPHCGSYVMPGAPRCGHCGATTPGHIAAPDGWTAPKADGRQRAAQIALVAGVIVLAVAFVAAGGAAKLGATPVPHGQAGGPPLYGVGQTATVSRDGKSWARITVSDMATASSYGSGALADEPRTAGNVFVSAKVTYEALVDGVTYSPIDWNIYCDNVGVSNSVFMFNPPGPTLGSGTLPKGRKAVGYVVYEVPPTGEVDMSYVGVDLFNTSVQFTVVLRPS